MDPENEGRNKRLIIIAAALIVALAAAVTGLAIRAARESGETETLGMNLEAEALAAAAASVPPSRTPEIHTETVPPKTSVTPAPAEIYIVRAHEGYIAVFRPGSAKPETVTDTRVSSLRRADQILLREGVTLQGRETLARFLEDFSY